MKRSEIDDKYKWNLADIYASDADWRLTLPACPAWSLSQAAQRRLCKRRRILADALERIDEVSLLCERLFVYARMHRDEDNANPLYQGMVDRITSLNVSVAGETSFVAPALLKIPSETLEAYIAQEKRLAPYAFMIRNIIREKQHVLSESEERLLSLSADFASGARDIFTMLNNADIKFGTVDTPEGPVQLTHAKYAELMQHKDRGVRKNTFETYYSAYKSNLNTIAATYAASVKKDIYYARVRGYGSALEKALFVDNVPVSLYDELIAAVHDSLPTMYDYVETRRRILGLDDMAMYDIYVPLVADVEKKYTYDQAMDLVTTALAPLGEEYAALLRRARNERWIDVYEIEGKTSGAYSWGAYGTHPYVLLNHRDDMDSAFTLAHELGHAMHSYYSDEAQPYALAGYTIFVAEVASTVNELLLTFYLLDHADDALKKYVLNHYLDHFRTTVRQTMFASSSASPTRWPRKANRSPTRRCPPVRAAQQAVLRRRHQDLRYHLYQWARIPHFYNAFYVYKYATGFSAAVTIATGIYKNKPGVRDAYFEFLKSGGAIIR